MGLGIVPCCSPVARPAQPPSERAPATSPASSSRAGEPPPRLRFRQVVLGASHACALTEEGEVWCWGQGSGEVTPRRVPQLTGVIQLSAVWNDTASLLADGSVWTWSSKAGAVPSKQAG